MRSRILDEYAKVFVPGTLPMTFRTGFVIYYETVVYSVILGFWAWAGWMSQRQHQSIPAAFFIGFMILTVYLILKLYPQAFGPSILFEDRLILRSLLKRQEIFKQNVAGVEIWDVTNNQSGTKFSSVVLRMNSGEKVKMSYRYGNIPEMYLTLRAWLAR